MSALVKGLLLAPDSTADEPHVAFPDSTAKPARNSWGAALRYARKAASHIALASRWMTCRCCKTLVWSLGCCSTTTPICGAALLRGSSKAGRQPHWAGTTHLSCAGGTMSGHSWISFALGQDGLSGKCQSGVLAEPESCWQGKTLSSGHERSLLSTGNFPLSSFIAGCDCCPHTSG